MHVCRCVCVRLVCSVCETFIRKKAQIRNNALLQKIKMSCFKTFLLFSSLSSEKSKPSLFFSMIESPDQTKDTIETFFLQKKNRVSCRGGSSRGTIFKTFEILCPPLNRVTLGQ